ncbi:unnamed protein product [Cunninghamella echinulata]
MVSSVSWIEGQIVPHMQEKMSLFSWSKQMVFITRSQNNMEDIYNSLISHKVPTSEAYKNSIRYIYNFNFHFNHCERRERLFAASQYTQMNIAYSLVNRTPLLTIEKNLNHSTRRYRKKMNRKGRNEWRQQHQQKHPEQLQLGNATYIAMGNGPFPPGRGHVPIPIKVFTKILARFGLVLLVDEYKTSKVCAGCDNNPHTVIYPLNLCPHSQGYGENILVNDQPVCPEVVNRDWNASRNIRRNLVSFMVHNGQEGCRPEALRRPAALQPDTPQPATRGRGHSRGRGQEG